MQSNTATKRARECLQLMQSVCHQLDRDQTACRTTCDAAHAARQHIKALTDLIAKKDTVPPLAAADWIKSASNHLQIIIHQVRWKQVIVDPQVWESVLSVQLTLPTIAKELT